MSEHTSLNPRSNTEGTVSILEICQELKKSSSQVFSSYLKAKMNGEISAKLVEMLHGGLVDKTASIHLQRNKEKA